MNLSKKYNNSHHSRPLLEQYVYFIGPLGLEVLGQFLGETRFDALEGMPRGYYAKLWRELDEVEYLLLPKSVMKKLPPELKPQKVPKEPKPSKPEKVKPPKKEKIKSSKIF